MLGLLLGKASTLAVLAGERIGGRDKLELSGVMLAGNSEGRMTSDFVGVGITFSFVVGVR